jgi:hypothetical protein
MGRRDDGDFPARYHRFLAWAPEWPRWAEMESPDGSLFRVTRSGGQLYEVYATATWDEETSDFDRWYVSLCRVGNGAVVRAWEERAGRGQAVAEMDRLAALVPAAAALAHV